MALVIGSTVVRFTVAESGPKTTGPNSPLALGWVVMAHTGSSLLGMMVSLMRVSALDANVPVPPPASVTITLKVSVVAVSLPSWS